ncbi:hypothetical protein LIA77_06822 [Sarocladium implicatum]|nr:hypothetical protein LIA77_06822 [Sarocladium implicatum]
MVCYHDGISAGLAIFGATITALNTSISCVRAVRQAVTDAKELDEKLESHRKEMLTARVIVDSAASEPSILSNKSITDAVEEMGTSAAAITRHLESMGGRGRFAEIAHQLAKGSKEKATLEKLMAHLSRRKVDMIALIEVLNVTLSRMIKDRLDRLLISEDRTETRFRSRVITNNKATTGGFMLNAPVTTGDSTKDQWETTDYILIDKNEVESNGIMINYATTLENLNAMAEGFLATIRSQTQ